MKNTIISAILGGIVLTISSASIALKADTKTLPLTSLENTEAVNVLAEIVNYNGREAIKLDVDPNHKSLEEGGCDNCTFLMVDNTPFKNGTIEIDLAGKPQDGAPSWARGFVGVVFRVDNNRSKYEGFYLRPMNAIEPEPRRNFSSQYFSIPGYPWDALRKKFPGKYEKYVDIKPAEWFTLKIVVNNSKAKFFIDGKEILVVGDLLQGADLTGGIGLFTEPKTDAYFSNLRITRQ